MFIYATIYLIEYPWNPAEFENLTLTQGDIWNQGILPRGFHIKRDLKYLGWWNDESNARAFLKWVEKKLGLKQIGSL